ncbi:MAG: YIP1 family protein [Oscillospiraceae bacterium]|nr:YIP1 family protein [Oscillospiraceae bacterium]
MVYDLNLPAWKWPFYILKHPLEGFEDLRWKKGYNMKVALIIVLLFFIVTVCESIMTGFIYNTAYVRVFNVVPYFSSTILLFFVWVVGNWSLCTLFNGEGSMRNICVVSAYALIPYIASMAINTAATNVLLWTERGFVWFIMYLGIGWSFILMTAAMKAVHQYSVPKTLLAMVFTVVAMVIMLFIVILLVALFQQIFVFLYTIYTEVLYRIS